MGEVYRARDTKLGRDVALKIIPEAFALDADRVARFKREAQVLASLNDPHIAAIYGFEDSGATHALVLELVEGDTLDERIRRPEGLRLPGEGRATSSDGSGRPSGLPVDEALHIARQIAEALEAAHEHGIIHRDLKPANIKITPDGVVKVLDFGLAKLIDPDGPNGPNGPNVPNALSMSPTLTSPVLKTGAGTLLGTAPYMAPEQAKGRPADKRSDIWAFGCVLYEMLTGTRAFDGEDATDVVAAIVRGEPNWAALPPDVPIAIRALIRRCLEKDRKRRVGDIAVVQFLLNEPAVAADAVVHEHASGRRGMIAAVALAGIVGGGVIGALALRFLTAPEPPRVARFEMVAPQSAPFASSAGVNVIVSPNGSSIVYSAQPGGIDQLLLRRIDDIAAKAIPGTERATNPFFSPDGNRVGFVSGGQLKTIALSGGPPSVVCDLTGQVQGATWAGDAIVFGQAGSGLFRVPAVGGQPQRIAAPDAKAGETDYRWPEALPGGNAVLYTVFASGGVRQARIAVRRIDGSDPRILVEGGTNPHYVPSGHLVYASVPSSLMAVPFDLGQLRVTGAAVPVQEGVIAKGNGAVDFAVAGDGTLVYQLGAATVFQSGRGFQWVGRDGKPLGTVVTRLDGPRYPRLSPNGRRLAVTLGPSNQGNIWIVDVTGATQPLELTFKAHNVVPVWRPDGKYVAFMSDRDGQRNLFGIPADGSVLEPQRLSMSNYEQAPAAWSPDGKFLLYQEDSPKTRGDLLLLDMSGGTTARPWLQTPFDEEEPGFSPDGRSVAYVSDQNGRSDVWVRPFPGPGAPIRVSADGGHEPIWSRNGRELFYQSGRQMMVAEVAAREPELRFAPPRVLFEGGFLPYDPNVPRTYDVAPDGRFLMIQEDQRPTPASLVIVQHWFEELKRLVPTP